MKTLNISNIGLSSINTDLAVWELPPENISYGINFRAKGNLIETTNASDIWASAPVSFNSGHVLPVDVAANDFWISAGRSAVYAYDGATWFNISSTAGYASIASGDEFLWTSTMLGSIPILNNPKTAPEYWSPQSGSQVLQPLLFKAGQTWLAANKSFKVIRSYNNFLFALNLREGGTDLPNSYRWSHPADTNGLPFTWDETDNSAIASIEQILGDAGEIVDGLTLRNSFCIYSQRGVNLLDYVGGEFVFRNRELSSTYGLLNRNSIVEVEGIHYFISDGDIYQNDGNSVNSILYNKVRTRFNSQINATYFSRSYATLNKSEKEIWFVIPETTSMTPNVAYIYNWVTKVWSIKDIESNIAHAAYGIIVEAPLTWANATGTNDNANLPWASQSATPLNQTIIGTSNATSDLVIINPLANTGGANLNARLERTDLALDGQNNVTTLTRIYPLMTGTADVQIQVGSQKYAGGAVSWKPAQTFNPSTDRKLDVRTTGEAHTWRVDSIGSGSFAISGFVFEYANAGKR